MKHILLVEDDLSLLNGLSFALKKQGYALEIARTKDEQKQLWAEDKYELLLGPGAAEHYQIQTGDTVTVNGTDLKITCAFLEGAFSDDVTIICPEALFHLHDGSRGLQSRRCSVKCRCRQPDGSQCLPITESINEL